MNLGHVDKLYILNGHIYFINIVTSLMVLLFKTITSIRRVKFIDRKSVLGTNSTPPH